MSSTPTTKRRIEYVKLSELARADRNPKKHDDAGIRASFGQFGYVEPVVIDERTGKLVAGHGRVENLEAAKAAGEDPPEGVIVKGSEWTVPVVRGWSSENDMQADAYLVASNKLTEQGGWDDRALQAMLSEMAGSTIDPAALGLKEWSDPAEIGGAIPPEEFRTYDDDIEVEHRCPSCGYEWSGRPNTGKPTHVPDEFRVDL